MEILDLEIVWPIYPSDDGIFQDPACIQHGRCFVEDLWSEASSTFSILCFLTMLVNIELTKTTSFCK
jgi:hypothetical protein